LTEEDLKTHSLLGRSGTKDKDGVEKVIYPPLDKNISQAIIGEKTDKSI